MTDLFSEVTLAHCVQWAIEAEMDLPATPRNMDECEKDKVVDCNAILANLPSNIGSG